MLEVILCCILACLRRRLVPSRQARKLAWCQGCPCRRSTGLPYSTLTAPHGCTQIIDESASQYFAQNNATFGPGPSFGFPPLLLSETVYKGVINGLSWCTVKGLTAEAGSRVRWHVGGEVHAATRTFLHLVAVSRTNTGPGSSRVMLPKSGEHFALSGLHTCHPYPNDDQQALFAPHPRANVMI